MCQLMENRCGWSWYEDALLSEIGVTKEHYRVTSTVWNGAPYLDEDDIYAGMRLLLENGK